MSNYRGRGDNRGGYRGARGGGGGDRGGYSPRGGGGGGDRGGFSARGRGGGGGGSTGYGGSGGGGAPHFDPSMPETSKLERIRQQPMQTGTQGTKVELLGNFFPLTTTGLRVHQYDLAVSKVWEDRPERVPKKSSLVEGLKKASLDDGPKKDPPNRPSGRNNNNNPQTNQDNFIKKVSPQVIQALIKANPKGIFTKVPVVHDGSKIMYTGGVPLKLDGQDILQERFELEVIVSGSGRGAATKFAVEIKQVKSNDLIDLTQVNQYYSGKGKDVSEKVISVYNQIFRYLLEKKYTPNQGNFYNLNETLFDRNRGKRPKIPFDYKPGFIASVRMTEFGLALNLHLKTACVIDAVYGTLDQMVKDMAGGEKADLKALPGWKVKEINKILRGLKIETRHTHSPRVLTIDRIVEDTPATRKFELNDSKSDEKKMTSVADYFKDIYKLNLNPNLPLVKMQGGKDNFMPMELCHLVPNQFVSDSKYDKVVQEEMLQISKREPNVYFDKLKDVITKIGAIDPGFLESFKIELNPKPVKFSGRVLPPPYVQGSRSNFYAPAQVPTKWAIVCLDDSVTKEELDKFTARFRTEAARMRLKFPEPAQVQLSRNFVPMGVENYFKVLKERVNPQFVLVVTPSGFQTTHPDVLYKLSKLFTGQKYQITCQNIKGERLKSLVAIDKPAGYFENFLLSVNGKLGGKNTVVDSAVYIPNLKFKMTETMVVGVDVNHPGATERILASVAVAVGSTDKLMCNFTSSIRVQARERDEMVRSLDQMVLELLQQYQKLNRAYPKNLIIFRDGVSEGQFSLVMREELPKIRKAIQPKGIKLTLFVVQKRHNTRYALIAKDTTKRKPTYNVPSGTVVDTMIVEPSIEGFLLNSHFSQIGTARPTKYVVLHDEHNLTTDQLEMFCYIACHNCIRTKEIISIPTPVKYADLCAFRAKEHIEAHKILEDAAGRTSTRLSEEDTIAQLNRWVNIEEKTRNTLYYC